MKISGASGAAGPAAAAAYTVAMTDYMNYLRSISCNEFVVNHPTMTDRGLLDEHGLEAAFEIMLWVQWARLRDVGYWKKHLARLHGARDMRYGEAADQLRRLAPIERELVTNLRVPLAVVTTPIPADILENDRPADSGSSERYGMIDATRPFGFRYLDVFKLANLPYSSGSQNTVLQAMMENAASGAFTVEAMDRLRRCKALV
jgi:hypothetical protein